MSLDNSATHKLVLFVLAHLQIKSVLLRKRSDRKGPRTPEAQFGEWKGPRTPEAQFGEWKGPRTPEAQFGE
ncbi:hypothetical protein DU80_09990 [Methanosarcina mazei]|uniref:Uncharacterized protein n=1 Tax=Methanosarcina mazei TaxID=2209 RepID=A0A0F8RMU9_METMZ|nr:hypothetical protein DU47_02180 [Methanosarcina mazei]KKH88867.1 hypothetical protein DU80_09990 [Methanosarcina mazei]